MNELRRCSQCGAELAADVPGSLCLACLGARESPKRENVAETAPWSSRFAAPKPEDLARYFPQLEILALLGQGGMGAVYKARQPTLDRLVAVKILPVEVAADPAFAERFTREARALARLNHPNIVGIHDFGQADGLYYFVMEFVDGVSLRQLVGRREITPQQALALVPQMCEALQFAHDEGIVHRDIKPENILIDKRGRVKIADFGLAKLLGRSPDEATLTRVEQVMGTPLYMAPEQMQGSHTVDHRADIYSLGVVFYEMLTGELPLGRFAPPSQKAEVDIRLDEVVLRALEREPDRRYQHASDVKTDVESIASGPAPVAAGPPTNKETIPCPTQVRGPAIGLLILGILGCGAAIVYSFAFLLYLSGEKGVLAGHSLSIFWGISFAVSIALLLAVSAVGILAGWKMLYCRAYTLAVMASVLAILVGPLAIISLPIGIWSLVVLLRRDVRAAFAAIRKARMGAIDTIPSAASVSSLSQVRRPAMSFAFVAVSVLLVASITLLLALPVSRRPWVTLSVRLLALALATVIYFFARRR
jgi:predicted Ser/Thr protein kinase